MSDGLQCSGLGYGDGLGVSLACAVFQLGIAAVGGIIYGICTGFERRYGHRYGLRFIISAGSNGKCRSGHGRFYGLVINLDFLDIQRAFGVTRLIEGNHNLAFLRICIGYLELVLGYTVCKGCRSIGPVEIAFAVDCHRYIAGHCVFIHTSRYTYSLD